MYIFFYFIVLVFGTTNVFSNKFHRNVIRETYERYYEKKSFVISTLSLRFSLCKLATIAEGKAKEEIMTSLELSNKNQLTQCHTKVKDFMGKLIDLDMIWFNKLYIDYGKTVDEKFTLDSGNKFAVDVEKIGFSYPKTAKDFINREVAETTLKRVTDIVDDSDINNQTCMMLVTGAHLKPTWDTRFNPLRTKPKGFYRPDGMSMVNMMTRDDSVLFYDSGNYKIVTTKLDWGTSMTFVMPTATRGISGFMIDLALNPDLMKELRKYMEWKLITFTVPKFKIKTHVDLTDIFNTTGINEIFMKNTTLLKNILKDRNPKEKMFISKIKEKIIIDVNEFGVKRDINRSPNFELQDHTLDVYSSTQFTLVLDRPFYFAINLEKSIVYGGKYEDPYDEIFSGVYYGPDKN